MLRIFCLRSIKSSSLIHGRSQKYLQHLLAEQNRVESCSNFSVTNNFKPFRFAGQHIHAMIIVYLIANLHELQESSIFTSSCIYSSFNSHTISYWSLPSSKSITIISCKIKMKQVKCIYLYHFGEIFFLVWY